MRLLPALLALLALAPAKGAAATPPSDAAPTAQTAPPVPPAQAGEPPAPGQPAPPEAPPQPTPNELAGGTHTRLETPRGPVHVWLPPRYDRRRAGVVVYVHGFYTRIDQAWEEHSLAAQFAASGRNAVFIAPEAPISGEEMPYWRDLRSLVRSTARQAKLRLPRGPWVIVGHSGAYRTLVEWLAEPALRQLILIDALYGDEADFQAWLDRNPANRLLLVVKGTAKWADPFVASLPDALALPSIPDTLTRKQRRARIIAMKSQYGHFELITEQRVLPLLLRFTRLGAVAGAQRS